uniref:Globin domain-containing protein n=1 Tax=Strigamia maritima TaxID=126957 RepID=T1JGQ8_STRMM
MGVESSKTSKLCRHGQNAAPACVNSGMSTSMTGKEFCENENAYDDVESWVLDEREIEHVIFTWKLVERNIAKVGVITFLGLFETHPAVQSVFLPLSHMSREQLGSSAKLEAHALKVMNFIQKIIARIDNPSKNWQNTRESLWDHVGRYRGDEVISEGLGEVPAAESATWGQAEKGNFSECRG